MNTNKPILPLFFLGIIFAFSFLVFKFSLSLVSLAVIGLFIAVLSFANTDIGLTVIIIAMMFSPELKIGEVAKRSVVIRIEDIFLFFVFFSWVVRMGVDKTLGLIKENPLIKPIFFFIAVNIIASLKGAFLGEVNLLKSLFFALKYVEYFVLFFMVYNYLSSRRQIKFYFAVMSLVFFATVIYGYSQIGSSFISTPFEGTPGEPGTYGAYIILVGFVILAVAWHLRKFFYKMILFGLYLLSIPPFLYSQSRASYMAVIPAALTFFIWTKEKKFFLTLIFILVFALSIIFMPSFVTKRIKETFVGQEQYAGKVIKLEPSAAERIKRWNKILTRNFPRSPLIGYGPGAFFVDGQYVTIIGESGILGLFGFVWIIMVIFRECFSNLRRFAEDKFYAGLNIGLMSAIVGLLTQALTTNTFILIRVIEPFWFLVAMVLSLPNIKEEES